MFYSYDTMIFIHKFLIIMMLLFGGIDCVLIATIRKKKLEINNRYVKIQNGYSLKFLAIGKTISILLVSYFLLYPPGNAGTVGAIALAYCLIVTILIKDVLSQSVR